MRLTSGRDSNIWMIDASSANFDDDDTPIVQTDPFRDFLGAGSYLYVYSKKGLGKTLALRLKAHQSRKSGIMTFPSGGASELVYRFPLIPAHVISPSDSIFEDQRVWNEIWRSALYTIIVDVHEGKKGPRRSPLELITELLSHRSQILPRAAETVRTLAKTVEGIENDIHVFIDNVDEAFRFGGNDKRWQAAQLGLIACARDIYLLNRRVKVFSTLRQEALDTYYSELSQQLRSYGIRLIYSAGELEQIFTANIELLRRQTPSKLFDREMGDAIEAFIGFRKFTHWRTGKELPVFDSILRHTRGRPRDICEMGRHLMNQPAKDRNEDSVRFIINDCAYRLFQEHGRTEDTAWTDDLGDYVTRFPTNIVPSAFVSSLEGRTGQQGIHLKLFRNGLLGYVRENKQGEGGTQIFRIDSEPPSDVQETEIKSAKVFLLHSCLEQFIQSRRPDYTASDIAIVGHNHPIDARAMADKMFHAHVGTGNISLGVVVPIVTSSLPIVLLQRSTSPRGIEMGRSAHFAYTLNTGDAETSYRFRVLNMTSPSARRKLAQWASKPEDDIIVLYETLGDAKSALLYASSFSVSVGRSGVLDVCKGLGGVLRHRGARSDIPVVHALENDRTTVESAAKQVSRHLALRHVVVDRICGEVDNEGVLHTEEYCRIWLADDPSAATSPLFWSQKAVIEPDSLEHARNTWRKKRLINDLHTVFVIFQYATIADSRGDARIAQVNTTKISPSDAAALRKFIRCQVARLLSYKEFSRHNLESCAQDAITIMEHGLMRFQTTPDRLGRVLKPNLDEFLDKANGVVEWMGDEADAAEIHDAVAPYWPDCPDVTTLVTVYSYIRGRAFVAAKMLGSSVKRSKPV